MEPPTATPRRLARCWDYYFFYGPSVDHVIALYRATTGTAPLFPKWGYGLFQSKDHYTTQSQVLGVEQGYRNAHIPLDVVVQDWQYWGSTCGALHFMDEGNYPDPATLVTQLDTANVHTMISIWPLYQTHTGTELMQGGQGELANFNALAAAGAFYSSCTDCYHYYDTFNAQARTLAYQQAYDRLIGKYVGMRIGWTIPSRRPSTIPSISKRSPRRSALGSFYVNAYPLEHNRALWEGWRKVGLMNKRVYILTRSAFAGEQRFGAGTWSGDISADWPTYTKQIPDGLSYAASGMPYWTTDIGGYTGTPSEELFTRWFQYGAFCPTFQILYGQASKELYGSEWSATGKANLLAADQLRYRLIPYIYSLAWKVTSEGYTIMRPLVFDYPTDTNGRAIKDQFLFGPALLVSPVTTQGATSRQVYLPAGNCMTSGQARRRRVVPAYRPPRL